MFPFRVAEFRPHIQPYRISSCAYKKLDRLQPEPKIRSYKEEQARKVRLEKRFRPRTSVPKYCDAKPRRLHGSKLWPAPAEDIAKARAFLMDCATAREKTLLVPDKGVDGLSAGVIIHRTLMLLGLPQSLIDVHLLQKDSNLYQEEERSAMKKKEPKYIIVLDQGSRPGPPITNSSSTKTLIIDHHLGDGFPEKAIVASAAGFHPVATSSLLAYEICKHLHHEVGTSCGYLCVMGANSELGSALKWNPPFPDLKALCKDYGKSIIDQAGSLMHAHEGSSMFDPQTAWEALLQAEGPLELTTNAKLLAAGEAFKAQVRKHMPTLPNFSKDGKVAILGFCSDSSIQPIISERWANHLRSTRLEILMAANTGYRPGFVYFSCRVALHARRRDPPVHIIDFLQEMATLDAGDLRLHLSDTLARGHQGAVDAALPAAEFNKLMALLKVSEKPDLVPGAPLSISMVMSTPKHKETRQRRM